MPIFLDEIEKLPHAYLDLIRDIADGTGAPIIMVGESALLNWLSRETRVWSRVAQVVEFEALTSPDVLRYFKQSAGIKITSEIAGRLHANSGGDFRVMERDLYNIVRMANSRRKSEIDLKLVETAIKQGLRGKGRC